MRALNTVAESKIMATRGAHARVCVPVLVGLLLFCLNLVHSREGKYILHYLLCFHLVLTLLSD